MKKKILLAGILATVGALCVTAQTLTPEAEAEIESKVIRTRADLRTFTTGLESYRVDFNVYPAHVSAITTPISFLIYNVPDVFEAPLAEGADIPKHLAPKGGVFGWPGILKMGIRTNPDAPAGAEFIVYGVGPDGIDGRGLIDYDPSNGTVSQGDIIRVISDDRLPMVAYENAIGKKIIETYQAHETIYEGIVSFGMAEQMFPPTLNALTTPVAYLDAIPEDPFLSASPISYRLNGDAENSEAIIYSVGPDLVDNLGQRGKVSPLIEDAQKMEGDVSRFISWSEIENRIRPYQDESEYADGIHPWKAALIEWQEKNGGRENAFLWYHQATARGPDIPTQEQQLALAAALKGDLSQVEKLHPWLNLWTESFEVIKQGRELDFAEGPGNSKGFASPVPNFLSAQLSGKALVASAMISLEEGDGEQAVDYLESALIMGRDYQSKGSTLISYLIGYAVCIFAADGSSFAIESGKLSQEQLEDLRSTMLHIERTREHVSVAIQLENETMIKALEKDWNSTDISISNLNDRLEKEGYATLQELPSVELFTKPLLAYRDKVSDELAKPINRRDFSKIHLSHFVENSFTDETTESEKFIVSMILHNTEINYEEAGAREATMQAKLELARTASAITSWENETGALPASLEVVAPLLGGSVPKDPFNGEALNYSIGEDQARKLWSVGPDGDDDQASVQYDPSNGTISDGDVIYSVK